MGVSLVLRSQLGLEQCIRPPQARDDLTHKHRKLQTELRGMASSSYTPVRTTYLPCLTHKRLRQVQCPAGAMDVMPAWTLDQIAGLAFGVVMVAFVMGAKQVDVWVAAQQRRQLGLCQQCGGLYDASTCQQGSCPSRQQADTQEMQ
eukprot:jgi/Chrzof1/4506/Cz14g16015.t1